MDFKAFIVNDEITSRDYDDVEIYAMYIDAYSPKKVSEISKLANRSIGEIYRIVHRYGGPNRQNVSHHLVYDYANLGFAPKAIAELTGYSESGVRKILEK